MVSYCPNVHFSNNKCIGLRLAFIKQNINFKFQPPSTLVFFYKLLKSVRPLKISQHTKSHGLTLTDASFISTSEV
jgi:hypothetical protein